jgi:hypothetical protein
VAADYACKTRNPLDPEGDLIDAIFPADLTLRWYKNDPVRHENLRVARFVLQNVERIFRGVRRLSEGGWCFTGSPQEWYIRENVIVPFPDGKVFAVYLNPRMRVYECRAEYIADDDPLCPIDWRGRYGGLIWKSIS